MPLLETGHSIETLKEGSPLDSPCKERNKNLKNKRGAVGWFFEPC